MLFTVQDDVIGTAILKYVMAPMSSYQPSSSHCPCSLIILFAFSVQKPRFSNIVPCIKVYSFQKYHENYDFSNSPAVTETNTLGWIHCPCSVNATKANNSQYNLNMPCYAIIKHLHLFACEKPLKTSYIHSTACLDHFNKMIDDRDVINSWSRSLIMIKGATWCSTVAQAT